MVMPMHFVLEGGWVGGLDGWLDRWMYGCCQWERKGYIGYIKGARARVGPG
jgi:hypothetical protein